MLRMSSYMSRGQKLIEAGKTPDAMRLVTRGFQHYAERVLKAIQPYAKADACMLVLILRHIADEIERNNPGTKEQVEVLKKAVVLRKSKRSKDQTESRWLYGKAIRL